jgi:hypothetical protein
MLNLYNPVRGWTETKSGWVDDFECGRGRRSATQVKNPRFGMRLARRARPLCSHTEGRATRFNLYINRIDTWREAQSPTVTVRNLDGMVIPGPHDNVDQPLNVPGHQFNSGSANLNRMYRIPIQTDNIGVE